MYGGGLPFKNRIRNACLSALRTIICARWTFSGQQYKLNHYDAGFALRWIPSMHNTDILMIHNNSSVHGLTGYLLTKAIKLGGNAIDFANDEATINVIRGLELEEYGRVKWDNRCVRTGWLHKNSSSSDILLYKLKA